MNYKMVRAGVDYSTRPPDWNAFARELLERDRTFVGRYLSSRVKGATLEEIAAMRAAGIDMFFWWETTETRAMVGKSAGAADAKSALAFLRKLGAPETTPVYYTVDTDTTGLSVRDYFEGIAQVVPLRQIGAYGGYRVIKYLFDHGLVTYGAQTEAWSYLDGRWPTPPRWDPRAQLRQWTVHKGPAAPVTVCGVVCDGLEAMAPDFGQWRLQGDKEDEMADELARLARVTEVADSFDRAADHAYQREIIKRLGGDPTVADEILAKKAEDVEKERRRLGLIQDE